MEGKLNLTRVKHLMQVHSFSLNLGVSYPGASCDHWSDERLL